MNAIKGSPTRPPAKPNMPSADHASSASTPSAALPPISPAREAFTTMSGSSSLNASPMKPKEDRAAAKAESSSAKARLSSKPPTKPGPESNMASLVSSFDSSSLESPPAGRTRPASSPMMRPTNTAAFVRKQSSSLSRHVVAEKPPSRPVSSYANTSVAVQSTQRSIRSASSNTRSSIPTGRTNASMEKSRSASRSGYAPPSRPSSTPVLRSDTPDVLANVEQTLAEAKLARGRTSMHYAAERFSCREISTLINHGSDVDPMDDSKTTPLMNAAARSREDVVKTLIEMGARVYLQNDRGWSALHFACMNGAVECVRVLLSRGAPIDMRSLDGWTPMHWAATHGKTEIVQMLIDRGGSLDVLTKDKRTPLHQTVKYGHEDTAILLLEKGANFGISDSRGFTPFSELFSCGNAMIAAAILKKAEAMRMNTSVLLDGRLPDDHYPLQKAALQRFDSLFVLFVEKGANINLLNSRGENILHVAITGGSIPLISYIIKHSPQLLDGIDYDGNTPIEFAAELGKDAIVDTIKAEIKILHQKDPKRGLKKKK